ncbi:unnamed protein product [Cylicocyclus nassatus]|uniref:Uncharacterized protein n=1 Tax=Cylicocyclus nassatus TaxID=53992 RepID=A0AA36GVP5_CYLNA|nr:unnamed protein product [Cylicocyclus nassatus]
MEGSLVYFPDVGADAWVRVVAGVEDVSNRKPRKVILISKAGLIMENVQNDDSGLYRPAHIRDGGYRLKKGIIYALHVWAKAEFDSSKALSGNYSISS